ncbi:fimbria/pilus chaperone family protein [Pseudomonas defluvii]|uniref:fimbria/pilus chaperone family protein n=1 Tax=Pseudomonas defluvii TaxID=1876757 RepID=UPI0039066579
MSAMLNRALFFAPAIVLAILTGNAYAAGMLPETSVILINVAEGEGVINVTNTDDQAALLYTSLEHLPDDPDHILIVTPPVARVEAGDKQLVRFIVQSEQPITTQRLKRVNFEGIPQKTADGSTKIAVTVRQNLPVLITPADLPAKSAPWTELSWSVDGQTLTVKNDSRYVVRLNQQVTILPANVTLTLPQPHVLPGQAHHLELPANARLGAGTTLRIYPVNTYGFAVDPFDAPLNT